MRESYDFAETERWKGCELVEMEAGSGLGLLLRECGQGMGWLGWEMAGCGFAVLGRWKQRELTVMNEWWVCSWWDGRGV